MKRFKKINFYDYSAHILNIEIPMSHTCLQFVLKDIKNKKIDVWTKYVKKIKKNKNLKVIK